MNEVRVFFFATFRDIVGEKEVPMAISIGLTVAGFKELIGVTYPKLLSRMSSILVSINKEFAFDDQVIPDKAEIALFPPVSGGQDYPTVFMITEEQLDLDEIIAQITLPTTGAACFFTGMVRGITTREGERLTKYLEYEAYVPMAESKMQQVADEIRKKWASIEGIAIVQRIGKLAVGTPTVMIACTAGHRDTGVFEASRYGIDRLKQIVPIWKKEVGENGEEWIEGKYIPDKEKYD
ncbi:MAG: molybdenum cofactor biosynthesis protein MoaE [Chloroflexota bacterium]